MRSHDECAINSGMICLDYLFRCDFFQAARFLEESEPNYTVRYYPNASYSFPPSELANVKINKKGGIELHLTFLGLYGVSSPLPGYFQDIVNRYSSQASCFRSLLAILNERMYQLFYCAWKNYRLDVRYALGDKQVSDLFQSLSGSNLLDRDKFSVVRLLAKETRNIDELRLYLESRLPNNLRVRIESNILSWVVVTAECLGGGRKLRLGDNTMLGNRIPERAAMVCINIASIKSTDFDVFLKRYTKPVKTAISQYIKRHLKYKLTLSVQCLEQTALGLQHCMLGRTTSLKAVGGIHTYNAN